MTVPRQSAAIPAGHDSNPRERTPEEHEGTMNKPCAACMSPPLGAVGICPEFALIAVQNGNVIRS
jgi:hypothetical protein